jgi:cytochrome P450
MAKSLNDMNFLDPKVMSDPFEFYRLARASSPVVKVERGNGLADIYLITTRALIQEVTQNPELFSSEISHLLFEGVGHNPEADRLLENSWNKPALLLTSADPLHKRYRGLVNGVFTSVRVNKWSPAMQRIVDELIDAFIERGECDFVREFAIHLPTYVISDIFGFERRDFDRVTTWSDAIIRRVSRIGTKQQEVEATRMMLEMERFIDAEIQRRRDNPGDDLISALIQVRVEGEAPLTDGEIGPLVREMTVAGNETTRNTLMSGIVRLLKNPIQLQALMQDETLIGNAVEELLRYETPASSLWRVTTAETELAGVRIPRSAAINLRFDSANRDEKTFEDPETFDITRKNAREHIAFGAPGIHRCLGQMLARKELSIAIPALLRRLKNLRLVPEKSDTAYWPGILHRGIGKVWLAFDPGPKIASSTAGDERVKVTAPSAARAQP